MATSTGHTSLWARVNEGDIVFHWWKRGVEEPALVGWSRAVGAVETSSIVWNAHGTSGRARGETRSRQPSWRLPLEGFTELDKAITLTEVRAVEADIRRVHDRMGQTISRPLYFPFAFSEKRPLRTTQGYLFKFPAALVPAFPGLSAAISAGAPVVTAGTERQGGAAASARMSDVILRKALESHAVAEVISHLAGLGYRCTDVGAVRPYDIVAVQADEELHVEVKGSSTDRLTIELTDGEVEHARTTQPTWLAVVDQISWSENGSSISCSGGRLRIWRDWAPDPDALVPLQWRYLLPPDH